MAKIFYDYAGKKTEEGFCNTFWIKVCFNAVFLFGVMKILRKTFFSIVFTLLLDFDDVVHVGIIAFEEKDSKDFLTERVLCELADAR